MDVGAYLARIDCDGIDLSESLESLRILQRKHLLNVPFENLDIHWNRRIDLDPASFVAKIVGRRRGGFCYELNGAFNELLRELGFRTRFVSARVADGRGGFGREYDHLAIIASVGDSEYLSDVGFGEFAASPISLEPEIEHFDEVGVFKIRPAFDGTFDVVKRVADEWTNEYRFSVQGRALGEFTRMSDFHQTSPESNFTRSKLCSIMTPDGRITLTDRSLTVAAGELRTETPIVSEADFNEKLLQEFAISKPG